MQDPLNPARRISITGASEAEVVRRAEVVRELSRDLKHASLAPEEVRDKLARRLHGVVTCAEAWKAYLPTLKKSWLRQARSIWTHRLSKAFGTLSCVELTEAKMKAWHVDQESQGLAPATIANAFWCLRSALNLQIKEGRLGALPWGTWRVPKPEPRREREACRSVEELELIVIAARARDERTRASGARYADMAFRVLVLALCGLRQAEGAGLGWADCRLDVPHPTVRIWRQALDGWTEAHPEWTEPLDPVKGRHQQTQRLHPSAVQALLGQRANLEAHGLYNAAGPVFPGRGARWRSHADLIDCDDFREVIVAAGLPNPEAWTPHSLRHSFGTLELVAVGGNLKSVQGRMRHRNIATTEKYLHASGRGLPESKIRTLAAGVVPPVAGARRPVLVLPPHELAEAIEPELEPDLTDEPDLEDEGGMLPLDAYPPELRPFAVKAALDEETGERVGDMALSTTKAAQDFEAARIEHRRAKRREWRAKYFGRGVLDYGAALKDWQEKGSPGVRPPEVTAHAERNRQRARGAYLRQHPGEEAKAAKKGASAWKAVIASWSGFLKRQRVTGQLALPEGAA